MWQSIKDFEQYSVSDSGDVVCHNYRHTGKTQSLKQTPNGKGYLQVDLWNNGYHRKFFVHRLVAQAFIPNPENKPEVDHIDGNRTNNAKSNLRWATSDENSQNDLTVERYRKAKIGNQYRCSTYNNTQNATQLFQH